VNAEPEIIDGLCAVCSEPLNLCLCLRCSKCENLYPVTLDNLEHEEPLCPSCSN
jgi:hypothetical protein